jgi:tRNA/rRNA methyltransferase
MVSSPLPAIVMVRPQMGENIGAVARAMMNFGLSDLRLVRPRDGWPNPKAHEMAAHADYLIEQARVYDSLANALADRQYVLAATARSRVMTLPDFAPESGMTSLRQHAAAGEATALVLGPESTGLTNEDMAWAHGIVSIPTDPANVSLNVAQAFVVLAYQWFVAGQGSGIGDQGLGIFPSPIYGGGLGRGQCVSAGSKPVAFPREQGKGGETAPRATVAEVDGLYGHLVNALETRDYFHPAIKREGMLRALRLLLQRASWSSQEVRTLRGIVRCLDETLKKADS